MHDLENIRVLHPNFQAERLAFTAQDLLQFFQTDFGLGHVGRHDHIKKAVQDRLIQVQDIHAIFRQYGGHHGNNANPVPAQNADHDFHATAPLSIQ